jgi:hypothetical protein
MEYKVYLTSEAYKHMYTVKPEITHILGGCKLLWVIRGYGFSQVYLHMFDRNWWIQKLWVIRGYGLSQYGLSQV